ncbi:MAG: 3-hydroxyisobutyrate dehydrogenase [Alphaproteobacteria bacterium]|nr:3-hydroxyisobutyrate dehydrogenase [Alphaproteobacteria bacterium]
MTKIAFLGLGNMGGPMARNLIKAGHQVTGYDPVPAAIETAAKAGARKAGSIAEAVSGAEAVVTMLPAGAQVREAYAAIVAATPKGTLLIDSSTIDVASARAVEKLAADKGHDMVDAPVSGGVGGAEAATLTFMVGGSARAFERAKPLLEKMGKTIVHAGAPGNGQAAKICNNMILGVAMIGTCEAFALAEKLGLPAQTLFDISSKSSGQSWSMTSYCPVPGPVPTSPANRDYKPGFTAAMMLKDLKLAQEAAQAAGAATPLGASAAQLYGLFCNAGQAGADFSGIIRMLRS